MRGGNGNPSDETVIQFPDLGKLRQRYRGKVPRLGWILAILVLLVLVTTSYYQIAPYEQGVVLRFGRHHRTVGEGPHLLLPFVERVFRVSTERQLKEEFGFRTVEPGQRTVYRREGLEHESLMLTGDLNIADIEWAVQYRIEDPYLYLFGLEDPKATLRAVAEAEMRGAVGDLSFDEAIQTRRTEIETQVLERMNEMLDRYNSGLRVKLVQLQDALPPEPVKDSYEEVNRARQGMERVINEALQQRNKILFEVEGQAKQRVSEAEGTKTERINRAQGDATRFQRLLLEYLRAPQVTRQRLYLEAIQVTLPKTGRLLIVDEDVQGLLPVLNLEGLGAKGSTTSPGGGS